MTPRLFQHLGAAGLIAAAALVSASCGEAGGNDLGDRGKIVADPAPPTPLPCAAEPTPFGSLVANIRYAPGTATPPAFTFSLQSADLSTTPNYVGYAVAAVRVSNGTPVSVEDLTSFSAGGGTQFNFTIAPDGPLTTDVHVEVDLTCGATTATKPYDIAYHVPTSATDTPLIRTPPPSSTGAPVDTTRH